jgi:hypothetical protein
MNTTKQALTAHDVRRLCVEASVSEKAVRRFLRCGDGSGKPAIDQRIRDAFARLGFNVAPGHAA